MKRLESLDALRGFDMFFIMGGAGLIAAIASFFPDNAIWQTIAEHMDHVPWDGLKHHDTIFPLFLFIAGVSFPFSFAKQQEKGKSMGAIYRKIVVRGLMLVFLGLVCNGLLKLEFAELRYCSVLARIGLAWMFGALLFCTVRDWRKLVGIIVFILVGYWLLTILVPSPEANGASPLTKEGNLACYLDAKILGAHSYRADYDPEGLLSTLPAICTALLGMLSGLWLRRTDVMPNRKALMLAVAGVAMAVVGWAWGLFYPINKALWSSSFVCAVAGYSLLMLALFYFIIDVKGWKSWDKFFTVIGMNSIAIFMIPRFLPLRETSHRLFDGFIGLCPDEDIQGLLTRVAALFVSWMFLYFLYRQKIFLRV